jgi:hypothetical protein
MNLDARDMVEAVSHLLRRGYDHEYRIREGQLYDLTADSPSPSATRAWMAR